MNQKKAVSQLKMMQKGVREMRLAAEGWGSEWVTLIAILMSARTRDETTVKVAEKLFKIYPTVAALAAASAAEVAKIIRPVNFFQNKTKYVIACAQMLAEEFEGKPPRNLSQLILLPGVGRKTANVFLAEYGAPAIGVDTHVAYISQKLGWTKHRDPHKIENDLRKLFPQKHWRGLNATLVRFGKTHMSRRKKDELLRQIAQIASGERV